MAGTSHHDDDSEFGASRFLGFAATFGVLYLQRSARQAEWAKYPAIVFGFIALLSLVNNTGIDGGPLVLTALGMLLLSSAVRPRRHMVS